MPTAVSNAVTSTEFAIEVARLASQSHCHQVVVLDVRGLCNITDYFVLVTGTSNRQMQSVGEEASELAEQRGYQSKCETGQETGSWVVVDFFDVILHLFVQETREFYDLDGLWADAPRVTWDQTPAP